jgi:hypothetical protein
MQQCLKLGFFIQPAPDRVADRILELRDEIGAFGTVLYTGHDWTDAALARRSMELMAKEVWPRIAGTDVARRPG